MTLANDINTISTFLSHAQVHLSDTTNPYDTIVLCVSAIFHCAETLFRTLQLHPHITKTLVLCGGIGHSTPHLYAAVAASQRYQGLADEIQGLPEAGVMKVVLDRCFEGKGLRAKGVEVLIENRSTNCGANAIETRKLLEKKGIGMLKKVLIIQDPTMSLRTLASFEKAFEGEDMRFEACPTFVPRVKEVDGGLKFDVKGIREEELWSMDRFIGLILGEVERLRDDENGYGPKGKGFIGHVDVPDEVNEASERVKSTVQGSR